MSANRSGSRWGAVLAAALLCAAAASAQDRGLSVVPPEEAPRFDEDRVALVIGNGRYKAAPLKNPAKDAALVAASLRSVGFTVDERHDLDREQMIRAIRAFGQHLSQGGVGVFYFAGHGMQVDGRTYLVPVGATIAIEADAMLEAVDLGHVLSRLEEADNRLNVVLLDACRNNPTARRWRSAESGLAFMNAPTGTLIAYATAPGKTAADGAGEHSVYSLAFAEEIRRPGLRVEDVFKRVRRRVRTATRGRQVPWESSSLEGDFYFLREDQTAAPLPPLSIEEDAHLPSSAESPPDELAEDPVGFGDDFRLGDAAEEQMSDEEHAAMLAREEAERAANVRYARLQRQLSWEEGRQAFAGYGALGCCGLSLASCATSFGLFAGWYAFSASSQQSAPRERWMDALGSCILCSSLVCSTGVLPALLAGTGCGGWWAWEGENVDETTVELVRLDPAWGKPSPDAEEAEPDEGAEPQAY